MQEEKNLNYWKENAKDAYITTPICVLRYITELENAVSNLSLFDVTQQNELFFAFLKWVRQADLGYPDEMLLNDFKQFDAKK